MEFDKGMKKYDEIEKVLISNLSPSEKMINVQQLFPTDDKDKAEIDRLLFFADEVLNLFLVQNCFWKTMSHLSKVFMGQQTT